MIFVAVEDKRSTAAAINGFALAAATDAIDWTAADAVAAAVAAADVDAVEADRVCKGSVCNL